MIPYTYVLRCPNGKRYYGVRFARNCSPSDLWTTYFTSSSEIKKLIEVHGADRFSFKIRRVFVSVKAARAWETKVLKRLHVPNNPRWANKTNNAAIDPVAAIHSGDDNWTRKTENRQRMLEVLPKNLGTYLDGKSGSSNPNYGNKLSESNKRIIATANSWRKHTDEHKKNRLAAAKRKNRNPIVSCVACRRVTRNNLLSQHSRTNCFAPGYNSGSRNAMYGRAQSEETKHKISLRAIERHRMTKGSISCGY